ncbi:MAG: hypothetical protein KGI50_07410 [Patescibacteria group bacterium]|nr:hypothetical protein [Patescibacteria group bacterium]MDE2438784.1 hypothetical protein [Patescibacteria group bacterium]
MGEPLGGFIPGWDDYKEMPRVGEYWYCHTPDKAMLIKVAEVRVTGIITSTGQFVSSAETLWRAHTCWFWRLLGY